MIPLSVPNLAGNEWTYIKECLDTNWVSSVGSYVTRFENEMAAFCGVQKAIAVANGTAALHISLMLAGVQRDDLVVLPNITFVAPANVIKYIGADPLLIDVDEETWQMDLSLLEEYLDKNTTLRDGACIDNESGRRVAAIVPVHVLGNMANMDHLLAIANSFGIPVVEDSTEALGTKFNGKPAGSFGLFGCLSFNGNKIITTGGGGMILTNDEELGKKAKHLTTQAKADPQEYYHDEIGYNYRLVNVLAALGVAQLEQLPHFLVAKAAVTARYNELFDSIQGAAPQKIVDGVAQNNWLYTVKVPNQKGLREHLWKSGIEVRPFWVPMNQLPAFRNDRYIQKADRSDAVYRNCLSLPCSSGITEAEQTEVIRLIKEFYHD